MRSNMSMQIISLFFPNNKNIILAANQASNADWRTKISSLFRPKLIPQGISAIDQLYCQSYLLRRTGKICWKRLQHVKTGQITYAVRDTVIDDKEIKEGDYHGNR